MAENLGRDDIGPEELALRAAVCARPDDDTPRLVLADWLQDRAGTVRCEGCYDSEDHGGSYGYWRRSHCPRCDGAGRVSDGRREYAEFVRLQCELESLLIPHDKHEMGVPRVFVRGTEESHDGIARHVRASDLGRFHALRWREAELLDARGYSWCDGLLGDGWTTDGRAKHDNTVGVEYARGTQRTGVLNLEFRRGFVESVEVTAAAWLEHGDAITRLHPVRAVRLTTILTMGYIEAGDFYRNRDEWGEQLLSRRWPGIAFELPEMFYFSRVSDPETFDSPGVQAMDLPQGVDARSVVRSIRRQEQRRRPRT